MKKILLLNDSKKGVLNLPEFKNHKIKIYRSDNFQEACGIMLHDYIDLFIIDTVATDSDGDSVGGIRFAEAIRRVQQYCFTPIIFLSYLEDPKLFMYEQLHCYAFMEKPYDRSELIKVVENALEFPKPQIKKRNLYIKDEGIIYSVKIQDILYIKSERRRLYIYTKKELFTVKNRTLENIIEEISSGDFIRCSRFYVVNKRHIKSIDYVNRIITITGTKEEIDIGPSMIKSMKSKFNS